FAPAFAAAQDDKGLAELRGTWTVVKSEPKFEPKKLVFDGDKVTVVFTEDDKKETKVKVDSKAKPAQLDFLRNGKVESPGIYEVNGDMLRLCFTEGDGKRPTEFKAGAGVILVTLKREKK